MSSLYIIIILSIAALSFLGTCVYLASKIEDLQTKLRATQLLLKDAIEHLSDDPHPSEGGSEESHRIKEAYHAYIKSQKP
jgi:hypothetical protein